MMILQWEPCLGAGRRHETVQPSILIDKEASDAHKMAIYIFTT